MNKIKLQQDIKQAIEAGKIEKQKADLEKQQQLQKQAEIEEKREKEYLESQREWIENKLPNIIKERTSQGYHTYDIGSNKRLAMLCQEAGLEVKSIWHSSARDPDGGPGNYEGYEYYIYWEI